MKNEFYIEEYEREYKCSYCGKRCKIIEETFDYAGTHCTHGNGGVHYTGVYKSACCYEDYEEIEI